MKENKRTSTLLKEIIEHSAEGGEISVGELVGLLGERAFGLVILIFSLPNSLPIPGIPGFSTVTGLPMVFFAAQMALGRQTLWLPCKMAARQFSRAMLARMLAKALPAVMWLERWLRPRWTFAVSPWAERVIGLMILVQALVLSLPLPGGNFLPGLTSTLLALALLEQDGMLAAAGLLFGVTTLALMYQIIAFVVVKIWAFLTGLF